jgi:hypothetical protein
MSDFGTGLTLQEANPWLRDEAERIDRILDVAERNSVLEGLPPFSEGMRRRLREELAAASGSRAGSGLAKSGGARGQ